MKKIKSIKIIALILALVFIMTACGESAQNKTGDDKTTEQATDTNKDATNGGNMDNTDDKNEADDADDADNKNPVSTNEGLEKQALAVDFDKAISLYKEHFKTDDINISSIDLDREGGTYDYEIEGWKDNSEYKLKIDANSGEISDDSVSVDDDREEDKLDIENIIKPDEAMKIALENSGGGYVEDWELSFDDGKNQYEINIEGGKDVDIDALTKEVLEVD